MTKSDVLTAIESAKTQKMVEKSGEIFIEVCPENANFAKYGYDDKFIGDIYKVNGSRLEKLSKKHIVKAEKQDVEYRKLAYESKD